MHSHISGGASAPSLAPAPGVSPATPRLVPQAPKSRGKKRLGWILFLIVAAIGIERGVHFARSSAGPAAGSAAVIRTAVIAEGTVERTIRLTGTTGAEKFASLITPRLGGNRSGSGRDGSTRGGGGGSAVVIQSNSRGTSSGSSSSSSTGSSSQDATAAPTITSTNGQQTGGGSAAFRSATSRLSRTPAASTSKSSSGSSSTPSTSSSSTDSSNGGLGSTASALAGTGTAGGGGGGANEFMLVLQDAVKPGAHVKKGEVIAEFDRQFMLNRLEDYRASVAQMDAGVRKLKAELEVTRESHRQTVANAKAALEKARLDVKTIPVLGAIEAESVKLAAEEADARYKQLLAEVKFVEIGQASEIKAAELELLQAQMELKRAEANADRMLIKAPINGLAVMQTMFRGTEFAQIQPGDQLYPGMMFVQVVDPSAMIINASVNQVDVDQLRIGQKAMVRFDAYPELQVPGHVEAIGAMTRAGGQRASFVKEIPVILKIDKMDARIIPDLTVSIDVTIEAQERASVVPVSAVFRDSQDATPYVFVKAGDSWERREVELGLMNNVQVAIRSGLKPGEIVAEDVPPLLAKQRG
jgi:HlyD family secretion protein